MKTTATTGEQIDQLLQVGATLTIALDTHAAGAVFASGGSEYVTVLDSNEFGLLLAPMVPYVDDHGWQAERQGIPVFVRWERIIACRAHPSAANTQS
jgi:hypothetical protein